MSSRNPGRWNHIYSDDNTRGEQNEHGTELGGAKPQKTNVIYRGGATEAVYGLGMMGAWVYYLTPVTSFWMGVLGILKGILWPAMLVYELLKFLNM